MARAPGRERVQNHSTIMGLGSESNPVFATVAPTVTPLGNTRGTKLKSCLFSLVKRISWTQKVSWRPTYAAAIFPLESWLSLPRLKSKCF